ncbi:MAG: glutathione S-transferase family protein [Pseudomonadota bacterium]|nr:glutathione S-transferase family protein [Pseudomonadota bacterium]
MANLTLISHHLCPYVQRASIALAEKGVAFERIDIDLANRPDWFAAISPLGKVPLLKVGDEVLFESAAIVEYLEETEPHSLHPSEPLTRARHRAWMEFGSTILADLWGFYTAADAATFDAKTLALRTKFERLEAELGGGPYFAGERFSLVDAVFAPVFRYFDVFDRIGDFGILSGLPRLAAWRANLAATPSVASAVTPSYPARLEAFIRAKGGHLARQIPLAA